MEKAEECRRYKWSSEATNLLISIWCHDMVQNHLKMYNRNQPIWESIARYMSRKGFSVTGLQCRTRIKNMLCTYQEAVKKNDPTIIEPYFEIFKKVSNNKSTKKKVSDSKKTKLNNFLNSDEPVDNINSECNPTQSEETFLNEKEQQIEFLNISNQDSVQPELMNSSEFLKGLENIVKAVEVQTKALIDVFTAQTQAVQKLLVAERERLELILALERESHRDLKSKLDKIISRLETNAPQILQANIQNKI